MNTTGRLFTGIIALVLIGTACIVPLYIADKWHEIEMEGEGAISYQDMLERIERSENNTLIPDPDPDYIPYLEYNTPNREQARIYPTVGATYICEGCNYGSSWAYYDGSLGMVYNFSGYQDSYVPANAMGTATRGLLLNFNIDIRPLNMVNNGVNIIKVNFSCDQDLYRLNAIYVYKAATLGTTVSLYSGWSIPAEPVCTNDFEGFYEISESDLNGILAWYNAGGAAVWCFTVQLSFYDFDYYPALTTDPAYNGDNIECSFEFLSEYYEDITVVSEQTIAWDNSTTYSNHTIWGGADVTVSYLDIQQWILGFFGMGIAILALAVSPFWNPIKDYTFRSRRRA